MSSERVDMRVAPCDHAAAKYAAFHWHYSRSMPVPPMQRLGVWEQGVFVGVVIFSRGSCLSLGAPFGLTATQVCELTRIALGKHATPVSRILRICISALRRQSPGLRMIVSFADPGHGHHGGVYQANGWIYCGETAVSEKLYDKDGRLWHPRQVSAKGAKRQFGVVRSTPKLADCRRVKQPGKYRYVMPLDRGMRSVVEKMRKPYPKRATSIGADAPACQAGEGGSRPTVALRGDVANVKGAGSKAVLAERDGKPVGDGIEAVASDA